MRQRVQITSRSAFSNQIGDATPVTWGNDASIPSGYMVTVECAAIGGAKAMKPVFFFSREVEVLD